MFQASLKPIDKLALYKLVYYNYYCYLHPSRTVAIIARDSAGLVPTYYVWLIVQNTGITAAAL